MLIMWFALFIYFLVNLDGLALKYFFCISVGLVFRVIVLVTMMYTDHFVYLLPIIRFIVNAMVLWVLHSSKTEQTQCSYYDFIYTMVEDNYINYTFLTDILLMSVSFKQTIFAYIPIYFATHFLHATMVLESADTPSLLTKICFTAILFVTIFSIYYVVSLQELMRFFEQQASQAKE